jgi:hypothetical protein
MTIGWPYWRHRAALESVFAARRVAQETADHRASNRWTMR